MTDWRLSQRRNGFASACLKKLILLLPISIFLTACQSYIRSTYPSQDGRFCGVVRSYPMLVAMPGQAGDAPGEVNLYDEAGRKLESAPLEMVQLFEGARWSADQVEIDLGLDVRTWQLPQAKQNEANSEEPSEACLRFEPEKGS